MPFCDLEFHLIETLMDQFYCGAENAFKPFRHVTQDLFRFADAVRYFFVLIWIRRNSRCASTLFLFI